ncbi:PREDICTED: 39S ribosomal protein L4, mitochondrial isoform X3 [Rhinopithecus bieti]|uniref:39S ribosomal protein L4, mitochondrial isoform X3 n=1 Tax=Rhinopithecus bieti TaxID=61621 RepID=UPI00083C4F2F|nr:PREDICTED: 39S ribosomal protein L4, mitochondrial isoform X3 [Rhinopithecus bieti]
MFQTEGRASAKALRQDFKMGSVRARSQSHRALEAEGRILGFPILEVGALEAELGFSCVLPPCRLDILHQVAMWQKNFKRISYAKTKTRAEVRGGGRKPWPQKGTGRARHGSIRSPLWRGGGVAHGPRGPTSYYYMLPMKVRALGLKVALSVKLAQDDLHIMDSLELPTGDPQYLTELARYRRWGDSVLLVDLTYEEMPQSIVEATSRLKTFNLIPAVGPGGHPVPLVM